MKAGSSLLLTAFPLLFFATFTFAQDSPVYNPHETFDPSFMNSTGTVYRSGAGRPGPAYWQNRADYRITAELNDTANSLTAHEVISYKNNSPDELPYLWLQLDQNLFREDSRGTATEPVGGTRLAPRQFTQGFVLKSIQITEGGKTSDAKYIVSDTRMQIMLPSPVKPKGEEIKLEIAYSFEIPPYG